MGKPGKSVGNYFFAQVLRRIGAPVTPNNLRFLRAMQAGEGTLATWNPLATTRYLPGATSFNSVGVRNYRSRQQGIRGTAETLLLPYYKGIVSDLRNNVPAEKIATQRLSELQTWGTGSLVAARLSSIPTPTVPKLNTPPRTPRTPRTPRAENNLSPDLDLKRRFIALTLLQIASTPGPVNYELALPLVRALTQTRADQQDEQQPNRRQRTPRLSTKFIPRLSSVGGLHPTTGLESYTARDFMAPPGTPVYAPFDGVVEEAGRNPTQNPSAGFGGYSLHIHGGGTRAFLTHFGRLTVRNGQRVRRGQLIGYVWNWPGDPGRSHIHFAVGGGDPLEFVNRNGQFA